MFRKNCNWGFEELFFEGPEKKLEIYSYQSNLLNYPDEFWKALVSACGAEIVQSKSTSTCKFFLLSESSLFVWNHKILMITCGRTELVKSCELMLDQLGLENIDHIFYERKNEYFPEYQRSFVLDDFKKLKSMFPNGYGLRFGNKDDHHLYLFESSPNVHPPDKEKNLEVLMYGVCPIVSEKFLNPTEKNKNDLKEIIHGFFPGFLIDEFWFSPCGYSMNAVMGDSYGTIHVTPEKDQNYISIELNNIKPEGVTKFLNQIYKNLKPRSCDIIYFNPESHEPLSMEMKPLVLRQKHFQILKSNYSVNYYHWSEATDEVKTAEIFI